jgi:glutamine amidotransferase
MSIIVIDYGMSNLGSIRRSLEECGARKIVISNEPEELRTAEKIILPGVGSFADGMANLSKEGWISVIKEEVLENRIPLLGICLGMQLLADKGFEGGEIKGLGLIPGEVRKLEKTSLNERIPHIGWNEIYSMKPSILLDKIKDGSDFYFVHSYHFITFNEENIIARTPYCGWFNSAIMHEHIFGTQFHPEKSQVMGLQVLKNFLKY